MNVVGLVKERQRSAHADEKEKKKRRRREKEKRERKRKTKSGREARKGKRRRRALQDWKREGAGGRLASWYHMRKLPDLFCFLYEAKQRVHTAYWPMAVQTVPSYALFLSRCGMDKNRPRSAFRP
ncbi:uncharacterized protein CIMG_03400 [Coccidioides immitis RS]|uniref:Uncharacterized protein n=4 Tax=Coccidioides immitis TaxID=5501 RepID=J3KB97_COCIM|nr:uncharacterized protein CIMG_03400 [Coccidioides immitis RS]EAS32376.3 hypothetical protein CIMG_03400 [Coccidioides immitis RS]KMP07610.1 hypothetical protein CIRG_07291 [Coccidioides immitis RMSCC 2394]KMU71939.1 hypothetical protein CISG_00248 [Coccidioides immitis RMSCC 3703]KMU82695.1 hypothetical protein CIHG_00476 [Coccidioides immitis H538.4]